MICVEREAACALRSVESSGSRPGAFVDVVIVLVTIQTIPVLWALVKYYDDWDVLLDCLLAVGYAGGCITKLITFLWHWEQMLNMLNRIRADWHMWAGEQEVSILHRYTEQGRKISIFYIVAIYSLAIVYLTQPIVPKIIDAVLENGSKVGEFPFPVYYHHLDVQKYYFYIIISIYVCMLAVVTVVIAYDVTLIVSVQHGCAIFAAVGHKLERIGKYKTSAAARETPYCLKQKDRALEYFIFSCITRHNDAIEYVKFIQTFYAWTFFLSTVFRIAVLSIVGLQIVTTINEPQETARFVAFAVGMIAYVWIESYIAQVLMDNSISIQSYIQKSHWYKLPLQAQKLLLMIMMRCEIPSQLKAGHMMNMSVESFAVFLKTSMSYLAVLRSI